MLNPRNLPVRIPQSDGHHNHHCSTSGHSVSQLSSSRHFVPVKIETSSSPDLPSASFESQLLFQLRSHPQSSSFSGGHVPSLNTTTTSITSTAVPSSSSFYPSSSATSSLPLRQFQDLCVDSNSQHPTAPEESTRPNAMASWNHGPAPDRHHHSVSKNIRHPSLVGSPTDKFDLSSVQHTMSFSDEYDDGQDLVELSPHEGGLASSSGLDGNNEKIVRRRSSKACDQCRKSKCKCERTLPGEPCRSCVMLGTPCTFLGPSRKRGPPKGYIDAIEARLHQTEALVGIMLSYNDDRARSLLQDISRDSFAREIINRVDNSVYGVKGRKRAESSQGSRPRHPASGSSAAAGPSSSPLAPLASASGPTLSSDQMDIQSTHPSNEWQDRVVKMLREIGASASSSTSRRSEHPAAQDRENFLYSPSASSPSRASHELSLSTSLPNPSSGLTGGPGKPNLRVIPPGTGYGSDDGTRSPTRRQRRRLDPDDYSSVGGSNSHGEPSSSVHHPPYSATNATRGFSRSPASSDNASAASGSTVPPLSTTTTYSTNRSISQLIEHHPRPQPPGTTARDHHGGGVGTAGGTQSPLGLPLRTPSPTDSVASGSGEDLMGAVGQLSLNEEEQVRYHGKASGLHLLGDKERVDGRNEGGIWRFPKARVWPPLPPEAQNKSKTAAAADDDENETDLPDPSIQDHLIELYFAHAHPSLPIIHRRAFFESYKQPYTSAESPKTPESDGHHSHSSTTSSSFNRRRRRVPRLLLYSMLAISARFTSEDITGNATTPPPPTDGTMMWAAGDQYLDRAKVLLDKTYASSKPSTCQALLLMGYREIGIGAMAQAWTYIGMAIRMAQDLGMHRSADTWARANLGGRLFSEVELQERKRIWYGCVIMDKYVSTYIGRPVGIFERDYDTPLPSVDDAEEMEPWEPHPSKPLTVNGWPKSEKKSPNPSRIISCFNTSAKLSGLLSLIVQNIYAVKPGSSRHAQCANLESQLDRWYIDLPEALRHDHQSRSSSETPLPHVLILHMQYWCAVLLLHRPFIRNLVNLKNKHSDVHEDSEGRVVAEKSYELCAGAANHITSIVSLYMEHYCLKRCPVFLCYYIFTASIMHVTTLSSHASDPQASRGLAKCMEVLADMEIVWPSASRALQLLRGSKTNLEEARLEGAKTVPRVERAIKRPAEQTLEDSVGRGHTAADSPGGRPTTDTILPPYNVGLRQPSSATFSTATGYGHGSTGADMYDSGPELHTPASPQPMLPGFFPPYTTRWPALDTSTGPYPQSTLNSVVMSQMYSTGLMDERAYATSGHSQLISPVHGHPHHVVMQQHQRRFLPSPQQQFWPEAPDNSYAHPSTTSYSTSISPDIPPQQMQQQSTQQIYLPDQYNMYNDHSNSNA